MGEFETRKSKLQALRDKGIDPFHVRWRLGERLDLDGIRRRFEAEGDKPFPARIAGRVTAIRVMGKAAFIDLRDASGKLQLFVRKNDVGDPAWSLLEHLDLGDFLGAEGEVNRTKMGEVSLFAKTLELTGKALLSLPAKWHGLADTEIRYRQRYLDLIANPESTMIFRKRVAILEAIRRTLSERGFLEVETPMLQSIPGGAAARPFVTHHNALGEDLFLRIAPELYLKRLLVGGFTRIFEINRNFRNEGISVRHNPEFTMLEAYQAYADYNVMADLFESVLTGVARDLGVLGKSIRFNDRDLKLEPDAAAGRLRFRRAFLPELWQTHLGEDIHLSLKGKGFDSAGLRALAERKGVAHGPEVPDAKVFDALFERYIEAHLPAPTFVFDHPTAITPLAKCKPGDESLVERFEFFYQGLEFANAYTELNDPLDQRGRFEEQAKQKAGGHAEAELVDEDFVQAMEHGMPPTGGIGFGIDRLVMLFTDTTTIREVILFPTLKPE